MAKYQGIKKVLRPLLICYRQCEMPTDDCIDEILYIIKQGGLRKVRDSEIADYKPSLRMQRYLDN